MTSISYWVFHLIHILGYRSAEWVEPSCTLMESLMFLRWVDENSSSCKLPRRWEWDLDVVWWTYFLISRGIEAAYRRYRGLWRFQRVWHFRVQTVWNIVSMILRWCKGRMSWSSESLSMSAIRMRSASDSRAARLVRIASASRKISPVGDVLVWRSEEEIGF